MADLELWSKAQDDGTVRVVTLEIQGRLVEVDIETLRDLLRDAEWKPVREDTHA